MLKKEVSLREIDFGEVSIAQLFHFLDSLYKGFEIHPKRVHSIKSKRIGEGRDVTQYFAINGSGN